MPECPTDNRRHKVHSSEANKEFSSNQKHFPNKIVRRDSKNYGRDHPKVSEKFQSRVSVESDQISRKMMSALWCLLIFLTRISAITLYCPTGKIYSVSSPFSALAAFEDQCQCQVAGSQETILSCELMIFLKYLIIFARTEPGAGTIQAISTWVVPQCWDL